MISKCFLVEPFFCNESDPIAVVAKKLKDYKQRHIYVVDKANRPIGFISITDILDKVVIPAKNVADIKAKDIMSKDILIFDDDHSVQMAYKAMTEKSIVSCAIVDVETGGKMIGILNLQEAIRHITDPAHIKGV